MSLLHDRFQGYLKERVYEDNPQAVIELKEAISMEIRNFGSEVTKAVIDRMKKTDQDYIQQEGHQLKNVVNENSSGRTLLSQDSNSPLFSKIRL